jgi:tRNA (cytidine32/uridine32-2'-O)-methyltransferase
MILNKNIRVVLVETSHPGNIGSSARAMKTMGFTQLYLVNPKSFPDPKAIELSAGASDVVETAIVVTELKQALADCQLLIATSARPRELTLPTLDPKQCAQRIIHEASAGRTIALVFGREHSGLTNQELLQCHYQLMIPANEIYSSLNLAAAVQIITYEIRMAILGSQTLELKQKDDFATVDEIEHFYGHLESVLRSVGFLRENSPKRIMPRLRRLFNRIRLENREVRLLRGILTIMEQKK